MIRLLAGLALVGVTVPAAAEPVTPTADVSVLRDGDRWTAEFRFGQPTPTWVFARSAIARVSKKPWRPESWVIETPGVRLERHGFYDVLVADAGTALPDRIRVRFTPFSKDLVADYDPALVFTDGSVALFGEQFDGFPMTSGDAADALPVDLSGTDVPYIRTRVSFSDRRGRVLVAGKRVRTARLEQAKDTYVLYGSAKPILTPELSAILDPQLPQWIRGSLASAVPDIMARYAAKLGRAAGPKPTLMVSWAGPTSGLSSRGGSVLPGLIAMTYEGEGVLKEDAGSRNDGLWFIAHEAAHFWLGNTVRYEASRDAWITEGGADMLAEEILAEVDPAFRGAKRAEAAVSDCAALTEKRGIASAEQRNEHRAYYACGMVFAQVAQDASGEPYSRFVRRLIDANRADGVVTRAEWLAELDRTSGDPSLSRDIARLIDEGAADPKSSIQSLLERAGKRARPVTS